MNNDGKFRVCLVEDDAIMGESLRDRLELEDFAVDWHKESAGAVRAIERGSYGVIISDIRLPDQGGEDMFLRLREERPDLPPVIFITGYGSIDAAVKLLKLGAADYITKPFDLDELVAKVRALCLDGAPLPRPYPPRPVLGISAAMRRIEEMLPRLSLHAGTVLITGESGVGKEEVAKQLHRSTPGSDGKPFVAVNCAALPEGLLEAELFGHEKGAFTGAVRARKGLFEQAHRGALFLDEIGDMPLSMQVKLLRAIQERSITRVGGETSIPVDLRLICATNRDLKSQVEKGLFREDLFYRINVVHLKVLPLRERKEDILWLAQLFLGQYAEQHSDEKRELHPATEHAFLDYPWPGNVRELKHSIERACILSGRKVLTPDLFFEETLNTPDRICPPAGENLGQFIQSCECRFIIEALEKHQWHISETAASLGISRKNLWEKIRKLGISSPRMREGAGSAV